MKRSSLALLLGLYSSIVFSAEILPLSDGLTLAQISENGRLQTLAVIRDSGREVEAINLSRLSGVNGDLVQVYAALGYERIFALLATSDEVDTYPYSQLLSPAGGADHHIALGFNYAEHAGEIEEDEQPFLFLKLVLPTRETPVTYSSGGLLDYEVEICARPMQAVTNAGQITTAEFGFFLCGDFTDRAELLRGIDLDNMQSGAGFRAAKSHPTFFPTGPYLVIPRAADSFLSRVELALERNGEPRQRATAGEMIWSLETSLQELFKASGNKQPTYTDPALPWMPNGGLSTDMTILTGTPAGVIMRPPSLGFKVLSSFPYVFSGAVFTQSIRDYVIARYTDRLLKEQTFLQPGEMIRMNASYLGQIELVVGE